MCQISTTSTATCGNIVGSGSRTVVGDALVAPLSYSNDLVNPNRDSVRNQIESEAHQIRARSNHCYHQTNLPFSNYISRNILGRPRGRTQMTEAAETNSEACCWICLSADGELVNPCACPRDRVCHRKCLARWQLQSAGKGERTWSAFIFCAALTPCIPSRPQLRRPSAGSARLSIPHGRSP